MKIKSLDHFVITTAHLPECLDFYTTLLGMRHEIKNDRHALYFGNSKINIHTYAGEFQPAAQKPRPGSLDLCLLVDGKIEDVLQEIKNKNYPIEEGIVSRNGALGKINSIYLYDPDGNLIELSCYEN